MSGVLGDTIHADRLLVLLTVQPQRLQVQVADLLLELDLDGPQIVLLEEALAGVVEGSVTDSAALLVGNSADGTRPVVELPAFLLTFPTEAVGTRQQDGVPEDTLTHRTRQVQPERQSVLEHFLFHARRLFGTNQLLGLFLFFF